VWVALSENGDRPGAAGARKRPSGEEASALSRQRPRTVLDAGPMHSIVYVVILTSQGLERFDCSKMTVVDSRHFPLLHGRLVSSYVLLPLQGDYPGRYFSLIGCWFIQIEPLVLRQEFKMTGNEHLWGHNASQTTSLLLPACVDPCHCGNTCSTSWRHIENPFPRVL
jgi:hypothetical protein